MRMPCFACLVSVAVIILAGCSFDLPVRDGLSAFSRPDPLVITVTTKGVLLAGDPIPVAKLKTELVAAHKHTKAGAQDEPSVVLTGSDELGFKHIVKVTRLCQESGVARVLIRSRENSFPISLPQPQPGPAVVADDLQLPPLMVRLLANDQGRIRSVLINDLPRASAKELQLELISIVGDERGPGSIQESLVIEVDCDDNLRLDELVTAGKLMSGYEDERGDIIPIAETIELEALAIAEDEDIIEIEIEEMVEEITEEDVLRLKQSAVPVPEK